MLVQELRDEAAGTYINEVVSGHPGSITSIHGKDAPQGFKKLFSLVKGSPHFQSWDDATLIELLATAVDVIIPFENKGSSYAIGEVWFAADAERRGVDGDRSSAGRLDGQPAPAQSWQSRAFAAFSACDCLDGRGVPGISRGHKAAARLSPSLLAVVALFPGGPRRSDGRQLAQDGRRGRAGVAGSDLGCGLMCAART